MELVGGVCVQGGSGCRGVRLGRVGSRVWWVVSGARLRIWVGKWGLSGVRMLGCRTQWEGGCPDVGERVLQGGYSGVGMGWGSGCGKVRLGSSVGVQMHRGWMDCGEQLPYSDLSLCS